MAPPNLNNMSVHEIVRRKKYFAQLSKKEMLNPYLVIDELFDFAHLPDVQELLWDWLKTTVTNGYHKNLNASERYAIITLYEKLRKLVEAVHVLNERNLLTKSISRKRTKKIN